jgi:hypothetical protein
VAKLKSRDNEAQLDELGSDPGQVGSDSAGQSGDTQGLSQIADAAGESVEELDDTDQAYEAEAVGGVEDAADHPERPVRTSEDCARSDDNEDKHLRDPEDRVIDECSEEQRKDKAMDKTLADSFPASDPPAWQS